MFWDGAGSLTRFPTTSLSGPDLSSVVMTFIFTGTPFLTCFRPDLFSAFSLLLGTSFVTSLPVASCLERRVYRKGGLYTCIYGLSFFLPISCFTHGRCRDLRTARRVKTDGVYMTSGSEWSTGLSFAFSPADSTGSCLSLDLMCYAVQRVGALNQKVLVTHDTTTYSMPGRLPRGRRPLARHSQPSA